MKIILAILVLIFSLQSLTKADDITDFEIEGMSIGDSLLNYISDNQIKKNKSGISESEIEKMIDQRNEARKNKDFKTADKIRNELYDKGVLIEDKDDKTSWKLK